MPPLLFIYWTKFFCYALHWGNFLQWLTIACRENVSVRNHVFLWMIHELMKWIRSAKMILVQACVQLYFLVALLGLKSEFL